MVMGIRILRTRMIPEACPIISPVLGITIMAMQDRRCRLLDRRAILGFSRHHCLSLLRLTTDCLIS